MKRRGQPERFLEVRMDVPGGGGEGGTTAGGPND